MEEKFLYHIWDAGHLLTPLRTASGKPLQVRYQGQFNTGRGPDFRNVIIELDGATQKGDVEIHINCGDWKAHEHHEDPHYNQVILHVVMNAQNQARTVKENGEAVEILELKDQLSEDIRKLLEIPAPPSQSETSTYCDLLSAVDNDALASILGYWGRQRFNNKVRRFSASLSLEDFDGVLYEGIMEALGYDKNKLNLLSLAQSIPLSQIRQWQAEGLSAVELVSILSCASGLLDRSANHLGASLVELLRDTYECQSFFARRLDIYWQLFRIRPASHPIYRLITAGSLLHRTRDTGLLSYFLDREGESAGPPGRQFTSFAQAFQECVLPGAENLPQPGKGLLGSIYVNIFLPISYLYSDKLGDAAARQQAREQYAKFPGLQENHITRFMGRYLSPTQNKLANQKTIHQQGLIEIFHRYCHYHLCTECLSSSRMREAGRAE